MVEEYKKMIKVENEVVKNPAAPGFPRRRPSKYYPGLTTLNFRDQTRTGVFIVEWPYLRFTFLRLLLLFYVSANLPGDFGLLFRAL